VARENGIPAHTNPPYNPPTVTMAFCLSASTSSFVGAKVAVKAPQRKAARYVNLRPGLSPGIILAGESELDRAGCCDRRSTVVVGVAKWRRDVLWGLR
jgi:hypothetical protein